MSEKGFRVEIPVNLGRRRRKPDKQAAPAEAPDDVPPIARLLALAHKWEGMVRQGQITLPQIAAQHGMSRGRVSQILCLTMLAPSIQDSVLRIHKHWLPSARTLQGIAHRPGWDDQHTQVSR